jgi:2-methylisocitrate lyase-like PEP mutase family enzyme
VFASTRQRFRALHEEGTFLLPNPWDIGSARILAGLGFQAVATTSSGHAASLGRPDQQVTRDELVAHVSAVAGAIRIPLNVDAERCFADHPDGIRETIDLLAAAGAAGISIEDYDPAAGRVESPADAAERVAAAARACARHGIVLTARSENYLYGHPDLDDTIARLRAYRQAGADVVYAPGLLALDDIARVVEAVPAPLNVLALPDGPNVGELAGVGVRRVSTGGGLARAAYGALRDAARELLDSGTSGYLAHALTGAQTRAAFDPT